MTVPGSANPLLLRSAAPTAYQVSRSLRFNPGDSAFLSRTPGSAGDRTKWTFSFWLKRSGLGGDQSPILQADNGAGGGDAIVFNGSDCLRYYANGAVNGDVVTTQVFRDTSAWYHFVVALDTTQATASNRVKFYVNGSQITTFSTATYPSQNATNDINTATVHDIARGYQAGSQLRYLNGYLANVEFVNGSQLTPSSFAETDATTGQWVPKQFSGSYGTNGFKLTFADNSNNTASTLGADTSSNGNNWTPNNFAVTPVNSYQITGFDATNGGGAFANATLPASGNGTNAYHFPKANGTYTLSKTLTATTKIEAYCYIDGTVTGTITANGGTAKTVPIGSTYAWQKVNLGVTSLSSISLAHSNWTSPGQDFWLSCFIVDDVVVYGTPALAAGNDSLVDTPTSYGTGTSGGDVRGNFCTLNPLSTSSGTYSQGNLRFVGANSWMNSNGTFAVSTGKWYYEVTVANAPYSPRGSTSEYNGFGWGLSNVQAATTTPRTQSDALMYGDNGYYKNFSGSNTDGGAVSAGDVLAVAVDLDANTFYLYKNNSQIATGTIGGTAGRELTPRISSYNGSYGALDVNFGQRAFAYTPPANHKPLVDTYLPTPTVAKPNTVMDVKLYTGNGSTQTISGLGFSPDLLWFKSRSTGGAGYNNIVFDTVRGSSKSIATDLTSSEYTGTDLTSFNSDGFTLAAVNQWFGVNNNGTTFVAWAWDAGSSTVTNTAGSISSQVRANASAGFSVVGWNYPGGTGASTIGHGLGVKPGMIILKSRDNAYSWIIYHSAIGATKCLRFTTAAASTESDPWNNTEPTSTVFSIGAASWHGAGNMIAYCFAPVTGYSAMGAYDGSGSTQFIYTGFRPKYLLIKCYAGSSTQEWMIKDSVRNTYNAANYYLTAESSAAEGSSLRDCDFLSNGFSIPGSIGPMNTSGRSYIYFAVAESPFQYARAR